MLISLNVTWPRLIWTQDMWRSRFFSQGRYNSRLTGNQERRRCGRGKWKNTTVCVQREVSAVPNIRSNESRINSVLTLTYTTLTSASAPNLPRGTPASTDEGIAMDTSPADCATDWQVRRDGSFHVAGPTLWNILPLHLKLLDLS